ncbi:DUF2631 domain-containing protein [Mycobacterium sp. ITM-2016-00318]|uniref:DUF2631 domain-containing protein n=1 Tax=Mycobacterium sp. ITM-2016-00318 TaxID=2099693 RepID=UPI000CF93F16|nr:DUF2631 domain-containing protein [Mycobacterium sp. ITM-2016-00318]WNG94787.1 DUF2631 domain-containing protein [Mycobacterium sp. ITM-2016-00318]
MVSTELDKTNGVDIEDVPSAAWGWSKESHKAVQIGGILSGLFILAMLKGNHVGRVEDIFLVAFAIVIFGVVFRDWWLRRRGWTR